MANLLVILTAFVILCHYVESVRYARQVVFPDDNENGESRSTQSSSAEIPAAERCLTPDRTRGQCVPFDNCPALANERNYNVLRQYICGYVQFEPKVCCPRGSGPGPTQRPTPRPTTRRPFTPTRRVPTRPPPTKATTTTRRPPTRRPVTTLRPRTTTGNSNNQIRIPAILPKSCGKANATGKRIVGGTEATPGAWPWVVALYIEERGIKDADCGAALISESHVITAAHCVTGGDGKVMSASAFTARMGEHNLKSDNDDAFPIDIPVASVIRHENFNTRTYKNDIALLKLTQKVQFNNAIQPICLPYTQLNGEDLTGRKAFVAGWGTTSFNGPSSDVLLDAQFKIWPQADCVSAYRNDLPISAEYFCAGDVGKDSCQGDSGGPLMLPSGPDSRFYQIGVVSFGKKCAQPEFPGVYTNVRLYLDWISRNL